MKKEIKIPINYKFEIKALLILSVICIIGIVIVILLRWDGWVYQINYLMAHFKDK
jgi:hypothetical protein